MLRFYNYDIVFQEIPGETTLAVNITNCPNDCKGCHSPHLMRDTGKELTESILTGLLERYGNTITCICLMGGDSAPKEVERLLAFLRNITNNRIKTAWYSGKRHLPKDCSLKYFDYVKLGPYIEQLGGLNCATTNQRLFRVAGKTMIDITKQFYERQKIMKIEDNCVT